MYDHKKDFIFLIIMNIPECSLWNFISIISSKKSIIKQSIIFRSGLLGGLLALT